MKRTILLFLIVFAAGSLTVQAQTSLKPQGLHQPDDSVTVKKKRLRNFKASLQGTYFEANNTPVGHGGLGFELFMGKYMSLNYSFEFGIASTERKNYFYYHGAAGGTVSSLFLLGAAFSSAIDDDLDEAFSQMLNTDFNLSSNVTSGLALAGIILLIIPEGINFNLNLGKALSVSPYINPLGLDYCGATESFGKKLNLTWGYGAKVNLYFKNKRFISPRVGIKNYYANSNKGLEFGLAYGFYF
jgi:hypothetical protein